MEKIMSFLDRKEYEALYERYINRSPNSLLDAADLKTGENVLDLCGGSGRLSIAARKRGAGLVMMVDDDPDMANEEELKENLIDYIDLDVVYYLSTNLQKWNVICCQQAINYWLDEEIANIIHKRLSDNGRFVFNTFHNRPPNEPTFKSYKSENGEGMGEMYYSVGNSILHVQAREGYEPHYTSFRWVSPEEYKAWLSPTLNIEIIRLNNNTDIYVCERK
jgi:SAM-dependent methyltransferase